MSAKEKNQISFENYPFFIAQPYLKSLKPEDSQRKDWQRMCLEMTLAFNASVCLAYHYASLGSDKDLKLELGMTSLGKWNQISRDVSGALEMKKSNDFMVGQISGLYGGKDLTWRNAVDGLIKCRNEDAHGALKDGEDLKKELDARQKLLEEVLNGLSFYGEYRFLVSTGEEVKGGGLVYHFKDLSDDGNGSLELKQVELTDEVEPLHTYLYSKKTKKCLLLEPMILSYSADADSETTTYVYNKSINDKGDLHYYNHRKTIDLRSEIKDGEGNHRRQNELCRSFRKFRLHFEDEDEQKRIKPKISVLRSFPPIAKVGDEIGIKLTLENTGKADAEDLRFLYADSTVPFSYPNEGGNKNELFEPIKEEQSAEDEFPPRTLKAGKTIERIYKLVVKKGGIFQFDEILLNYDYEDDVKGEKVKGNFEEDMNVSSADPAILQVLDPNDPQAQIPIVNLSFGYSNSNPKIGEEFEYLVTADNIGRGIAHDLELHIFPPPNDMELISGSARWQGSLNPGEKVERKFFLRSRKEGVFGIRMRDVMYKNMEGHLFKTLAYEDQKVLVLNDPKEKYRYLLEDAWHDLKIEDYEKARIERNKDFTKLEIDQKKKIETDVKIMAYGRVIEENLAQKGLSYRKISKKGEMVYCYEAGEFLFPLVVLSFQKDKEFQLLIKDRSKDHEPKNTWRGRWNNVLFSAVSVEKLSKEEEPSNKIKGLIGKAVSEFAPVKSQIEFLLKLGLEMQAYDLFDKISLDGGSVQAIVSNSLVGQYVFDKIGLSLEKVSKNQVQHLVEVSWPQEGNAELQKYLPKDYEFVGRTKVRMSFESKGSDMIDEMTQKLETLLSDMVEGKSNLALEELEKTDGLKDAINSLQKDEGVHCRKERFVVRRDNNGNIKKEKEFLVFYRGRELPYYDPTLAFMRYDTEMKKVHLHYLDKETFRDLDQQGTGDLETHRTGQNGWLYELSGDVVAVEMTRKAYDQAKRGEPHPVTYGLLHTCLKHERLKFLSEPLRDLTKENEWIDLPPEIEDLGLVTSTVNKLNLRPFLEYRSGEKNNASQFKILDHSLDQIKEFMDDNNA